ncbi:MAG: peptide deformylase [Arcobacter sp.]|nr:peptide deformylase [Arcobacter sp.]
MIREVITYPNKLLRLKSKDVEQFDSELHTLLDDMYETMISQNGVGLAAIQVAIPLNVLIINLPNEDDIQNRDDLIEAINPIITHKDGTQVFTEGCLSVPGIRGLVPRYQSIEIEYTDRFGEIQRKELTDFVARIFQHEFDHLEGMLFIDRVESTRDLMTEDEYQKQVVKQL